MEALIIIDMQNDFLPGGSLAVPNGNEIINVINKLCDRFEFVIASKDVHPKGHISFASTHHKKPLESIQIGLEEQVLWPDHCIKETRGEKLSEKINQEKITQVFVKGTRIDSDSYSAFYEDSKKTSTKLLEYLKKHHITKVYLSGVSAEYCVKMTALDALALGFETYIVKDAIGFLNPIPEFVLSYFEDMNEKKIQTVSSQELLK